MNWSEGPAAGVLGTSPVIDGLSFGQCMLAPIQFIDVGE
jgi:hypothetical protein